MTHSEIKKYCLDRLTEIRQIMEFGNPWGFVCAASFIDLLSKINKGKDKKGPGYKDFINKWFPEAYKRFQYTNGKCDLPCQFYHIFRCGILHSFSFFPTQNKLKYRKRSVLIAHKCNYKHLENYNENGMDSAIIIAENLCDDLNYAIDNMFKDKNVKRNSEKWVKINPLINSISNNASQINSHNTLINNTISLSA